MCRTYAAWSPVRVPSHCSVTAVPSEFPSRRRRMSNPSGFRRLIRNSDLPSPSPSPIASGLQSRSSRTNGSAAAARKRREAEFVSRRKAGPPDPLDRNYRKDVRPLISKPATRSSQALDGKRPAKPIRTRHTVSQQSSSPPKPFTANKIYFADGWYCCGYCNIANKSRRAYGEHERGKKHKKNLLLSKYQFPADLICRCRKNPFDNKLHFYRHATACRFALSPKSL